MNWGMSKYQAMPMVLRDLRRKGLEPTGMRFFMICVVSALQLLLAQGSLAEAPVKQEPWRSTDPLETQSIGDCSKLGLKWDLNMIELLDIRQTIQWTGVPGTEWDIRLGFVESPTSIVRDPRCYQSLGRCDSA
jgi:hypothetical protein